MSRGYHIAWVVSALMMSENADRIRPLRWGWIAVACEIDAGYWIGASTAAKLSGLDTTILRRLVGHGLVTAVQWVPGDHYQYLHTEMKTIARLTAGVDKRDKIALLMRLLERALSV